MKKDKLEDIMLEEDTDILDSEEKDLFEEGSENLEDEEKVSDNIEDMQLSDDLLEEDSLLEDDLNEEVEDADDFELEKDEGDSSFSDEELLTKKIFDEEHFSDVKKIVDKNEPLPDEQKMGIEDLLKKDDKNNNNKRNIIIAIVIIIIIIICLFVVLGKKKDTKPSGNKNTNTSTNSSNEPSEDYKYQEIMNLYGEKCKENIKSYYDLNESLPTVFPDVLLGEHSVVCEIREMYTPEVIYLGNCSIDSSEPIYSYGNPLNPIPDSNTNTNKPSNTNSNKPTNTNTNKPTNTNTNKPSNTNTNVNTTPQTVTTGSISNSGNKNQHTSTKFGSFTKVVDIVKEDMTTYNCTYEECYSGNGGKIAYANDGSMIFNAKNPIVSYNLPSSSKIDDQYSINITVKGNTLEQPDKYGGAILGISKTDANYLAWIGYNDNNLIVYTFVANTSSESGVAIIPFSSYNNKIVNIQIVAKRNGNTSVYANGKKIQTFKSGTDKLPFGPVTLGDLRPGRGLKFSGNIYEAVVYDRLLSESEVKTNYEAAKSKYSI